MQVTAQLSWPIHVSGTLGEESQRREKSFAVRSALGFFTLSCGFITSFHTLQLQT